MTLMHVHIITDGKRSMEADESGGVTEDLVGLLFFEHLNKTNDGIMNKYIMSFTHCRKFSFH